MWSYERHNGSFFTSFFSNPMRALCQDALYYFLVLLNSLVIRGQLISHWHHSFELIPPTPYFGRYSFVFHIIKLALFPNFVLILFLAPSPHLSLSFVDCLSLGYICGSWYFTSIFSAYYHQIICRIFPIMSKVLLKFEFSTSSY